MLEAKMLYTKEDVQDLPVYKFISGVNFLDALAESEAEHCLISALAWEAIVGDTELFRLFKPSTREDLLNYGYFGTLLPYSAEKVTVFVDAYMKPEDRIFLPIVATNGSFILVPTEQQKEFKCSTD
jgi:hypothetical protein